MSLIGSVLGSVATSVVGGLLKGDEKEKSSQKSQPFSSFMGGREPMSYADYNASTTRDLRAGNNDTDPAAVAPMMDWTNLILGIKPEDLDKRISDGKDDDD